MHSISGFVMRTRGGVNATTSQQMRGKWEERRKQTRGGGFWKAGGASRGQDATAATAAQPEVT
jgi:hypothetical protein